MVFVKYAVSPVCLNKRQDLFEVQYWMVSLSKDIMEISRNGSTYQINLVNEGTNQPDVVHAQCTCCISPDVIVFVRMLSVASKRFMVPR